MCSEKADVIERITASSSTCLAMCGNSSLTGVPLWPWGENFHGLPSVLPLLLNCVGSIFMANGLPFCSVNSGLGSHVSTCDGPPSM